MSSIELKNKENPSKVNKSTIRSDISKEKRDNTSNTSNYKIISNSNKTSEPKTRKSEQTSGTNNKSRSENPTKSFKKEKLTDQSSGNKVKVGTRSTEMDEHSVSNDKRSNYSINENSVSKSGKYKKKKSTEKAEEYRSDKRSPPTHRTIKNEIRASNSSHSSKVVTNGKESSKRQPGYPSLPHSIPSQSNENGNTVISIQSEEKSEKHSGSRQQVVEKSPDESVIRTITYLENGRKRIVTKIRLMKHERLEDFDVKLLDEHEREKFMEAIKGIATKELTYPRIDEFLKSIRSQSKIKTNDSTTKADKKGADAGPSSKTEKPQSMSSSKLNPSTEKRSYSDEKKSTILNGILNRGSLGIPELNIVSETQGSNRSTKN